MNRIVRYQYPIGASLFPTTSLFAGRSPWAGLESEIDRVFESAFADIGATGAPRFPVDVYEDAENTYVRAELPGVDRNEINVEMVDGYVNLTANRKDGDQTFTFSRSVALPETVQDGKVSAAYENGVLTVTLPKQEKAKPRKIAISVK